MESNRLIEATTVTLTALIMLFFSPLLSFITGTDKIQLILLSMVTTGMIYFFSCGETKTVRIKYTWFYALLLFGTTALCVWITQFDMMFVLLVRTAFIFLCCCLGRYIPGGKLSGFFLIGFYLVFLIIFPVQSVVGHENDIIRAALVAIGLATVFYTVFLACFPETSGFSSDRVRDPYLFKMAFRMTVSLSVAFLIAALAGSSHASWICFSILVTQGNLGATVKRSVERIAGTIIGIIAGTLVATLLFQHYPSSLYLDLLFLFLTCYFMKHRYWAAMIFATLLITSSFYLFHPVESSIYLFLLARLADTALGIIICLVGELLIFYRSVFDEMRGPLFKLLEHLDTLLRDVSDENSSDKNGCMEQQWQQTRKDWALIADKIDIIKYEPVVYISRRYWVIKNIYLQLSEIIYLLYDKHSENKPLTSAEKEAVKCLRQFTHVIKSYRPDLEVSRFTVCIKALDKQKKAFKNNKNPKIENAPWPRALFKATCALVESYHTLLKAHPLAVRWKDVERDDENTHS